GCPSWPSCDNGKLVAHGASDLHQKIESINRVFTGLISVVVIAAVLGALARRPRRRDLTLLAWGLVAGVVAQAVLGGLVVLIKLAPPFVMAHFLLSITLLSNAIVLFWRAGHEGAPRRVAPLALARAGRVLVVAA